MLPFKTINIFCWIFCFLDRFASVKNKPCKGTATYKLSFQAEWTESTSRPANAHFSGLIGCSHNHCYEMWKPGERASPGVKNVAERGNSQLLQDDVRRLKRNKTTLEVFHQSNSIIADGASSLNDFQVDALHPLVSVITKITPSPDWFLGVRNVDLCDRTTGEWLMTKQVSPLLPYDAGTDSGTQFSDVGGSNPTRPADDIYRISGGPLSYWITSERLEDKSAMGSFHFSLKSSLTAPGIESDESFQCPNVASRFKLSYFLVVLVAVLSPLIYH